MEFESIQPIEKKIYIIGTKLFTLTKNCALQLHKCWFLDMLVVCVADVVGFITTVGESAHPRTGSWTLPFKIKGGVFFV